MGDVEQVETAGVTADVIAGDPGVNRALGDSVDAGVDNPRELGTDASGRRPTKPPDTSRRRHSVHREGGSNRYRTIRDQLRDQRQTLGGVPRSTSLNPNRQSEFVRLDVMARSRNDAPHSETGPKRYVPIWETPPPECLCPSSEPRDLRNTNGDFGHGRS